MPRAKKDDDSRSQKKTRREHHGGKPRAVKQKQIDGQKEVALRTTREVDERWQQKEDEQRKWMSTQPEELGNFKHQKERKQQEEEEKERRQEEERRRQEEGKKLEEERKRHEEERKARDEEGARRRKDEGTRHEEEEERKRRERREEEEDRKWKEEQTKRTEALRKKKLGKAEELHNAEKDGQEDSENHERERGAGKMQRKKPRLKGQCNDEESEVEQLLIPPKAGSTRKGKGRVVGKAPGGSPTENEVIEISSDGDHHPPQKHARLDPPPPLSALQELIRVQTLANEVQMQSLKSMYSHNVVQLLKLGFDLSEAQALMGPSCSERHRLMGLLQARVKSKLSSNWRHLERIDSDLSGNLELLQPFQGSSVGQIRFPSTPSLVDADDNHS